ncbi:hypothetical protein QFX18_11500 [Saccharophagus degradans]|uniref:hypothetical protein n=1 Tax=Saccharophagus degradans TaxID=86304 RepID=UPI00247822FC|nr:hypothetical protein [Saccharophagus degradans]WGO96671.1 hypothetical protein QFX18_11500 [Saccharophagus degradans]
MTNETKLAIEKYCCNVVEASGLLYQNNLYGQMFILIYSSIDSMGLLDAPATQTKATGSTFKEWAKKYLLANGDFEYNEIDLWAARCAVLHTYTSESDLSKSGSAKQLQYYAGPKDNPKAEVFKSVTPLIDGGKYAPAHIEDTYMAFLTGIESFSEALIQRCKRESDVEKRVLSLLQDQRF